MKTKKFVTDSEVVLNHPAINDVLIYDIETDSLDKETAKAKFVGMYSYKHKKYFIFNEDEKDEIQNMIDEHKIIVGFNNKGFDNPIMENTVNNFSMEYKICFDCLSILYDFNRRRPNRESCIILPDGRLLADALPNRKLKTVGEVIGLSVTKGDIDYNIFRQDKWTEVELKSIHTYLYKDVVLTRELFEFYVKFFAPFSEYVDDENIKKFNYIRSSLGSYTYSAICHLSGIEPEFEDDFEKLEQRPLNNGGFVLPPQTHYGENIVYGDFASLYPHIFFMCNLFSPVPKGTPGEWDGGELFNLQSSYDTSKLGPIETILKDIYLKRDAYKKAGDPRQYALKIMINTLYGITGSPIFKNVFNMTTSGDCTEIGRTCLQYMVEKFNKEGYKVIYGDTDSCFVTIPEGKSIDDYKILAKKFSNELLSNFPFPSDTFKLDIDDTFKKVWLFKKKNYVGINTKGKIIVKGLPIKKHNATKLGQKIYQELKSEILEIENIKFDRQKFEERINKEIKEDVSIMAQTYNVKALSEYKSGSSIQAQISTVLGEGTHLLIPNKKIGTIGKSKKYCTPGEAKELDYRELYLDKVWVELSPFIEGEDPEFEE